MADEAVPQSPQKPVEAVLLPDEVISPSRPPEAEDDALTATQTSQSEHVQAEMAEKLRRGLPLTAAERQKMAVTLRMSGATYRRIGEALGVSHVQAKRYCDRAFEQHATDSIEQLRMIQFSRIEHMIMLLWPQVNTRDIAAIHTVRALMNDENTIMGVGAGETSSITTSSRTIIATGNKEEFVKALQEARATQQREEEALEQEAQEPQEEEDPADTQADAS